MSRLAVCVAVLLAGTSSAAIAADWNDGWGDDPIRGSMGNEPRDWSDYGDTDDGIHIETGLRYWYSQGAQRFEAMGDTFAHDDTSSIIEGHLRIDDYSSRTYGKAIIGYSAAINGTYDDPSTTGGLISDGHIGYGGADFGWNTFGDGNGTGVGIFAGYQYWNDSPRTDRANFTTAQSASDVSYDKNTGQVFLPFDSVDNNIDINALRLGVSGRTKFDMFDISAEVAAIPYAKIGGVLGDSGFDPEMTTPLGNYSFVKSSETVIDGWGYGAMGDVMVGVTPIENLTFRVGGRAWYVTGTVDATYSALSLTDPSDSDPTTAPKYDTAPTVANQRYIDTANPFSLFRGGLLAEMTYSF